VKQIAARKQCSIAEAVYWYNLAPKDGSDPSTAPANKLYGYNVRVYGIDHPPLAEFGTGNPNSVGDAVWVKPPGSRCHTRFDHGTVTKVISDLAAEVDGIRAISATCVMLHKDRLIVFLRMMSRKTRFSAMMITC